MIERLKFKLTTREQIGTVSKLTSYCKVLLRKIRQHLQCIESVSILWYWWRPICPCTEQIVSVTWSTVVLRSHALVRSCQKYFPLNSVWDRCSMTEILWFYKEKSPQWVSWACVLSEIEFVFKFLSIASIYLKETEVVSADTMYRLLSRRVLTSYNDTQIDHWYAWLVKSLSKNLTISSSYLLIVISMSIPPE